MKIKIFFAWYDFWVGIYYAQKERAIYVCLIPTVVIKLEGK